VRDRYGNYPRLEPALPLLSDGEEEVSSEDEEALSVSERNEGRTFDYTSVNPIRDLVRDIRVAEEEAIVEEEEEVHNREDSSSRDLSPGWRRCTITLPLRHVNYCAAEEDESDMEEEEEDDIISIDDTEEEEEDETEDSELDLKF